MRTLLLAILLSLPAIAGCSKSETKESAPMVEAKVAEVTIAQADTLLASQQAQAVDANGDRTRQKMGVIPGAVLLTDSETFAPSELPADKSKTLIFYCANTSCGASHEAASKAITAGYTNAKVLPEGIAGWVKAGKQVQQI